MNHENAPAWPDKRSLFGVDVTATTYEAAVDAISAAAWRREGGLVTALAVHGLMTASQDPALREAINGFDMVAPDGQPVRHALNLLHRSGLRARVYGPELMLRLCQRAAARGIGVYLYGSHPEVVARLACRLRERYPGLHVAGAEPSLFRPLTDQEDAQLAQRINDSGAGLVFVGLGCPLQETFAWRHRGGIRAVQVCVGAAFDFHSGNKRMAPRWMQGLSLEWLHRMMQEPNRLWRRYLFTNSLFLVKLIRELVPLSRSARQVSTP